MVKTKTIEIDSGMTPSQVFGGGDGGGGSVGGPAVIRMTVIPTVSRVIGYAMVTNSANLTYPCFIIDAEVYADVHTDSIVSDLFSRTGGPSAYGVSFQYVNGNACPSIGNISENSHRPDELKGKSFYVMGRGMFDMYAPKRFKNVVEYPASEIPDYVSDLWVQMPVITDLDAAAAALKL